MFYIVENIGKITSANIYRVRKMQGMTQEQAAELAGVSLPTYGRAENPNHRPDLATLEKISKGLSVPLWELLRPGSAGPTHEHRRLFDFIRSAKPHQIETLLDIVEGFERRERLKAKDDSGDAG